MPPSEADLDQRRVAALGDYDALDGAARPELAAVVELAAAICGVPMATIDLITATDQHQIESFGFTAEVCQREESLCNVILHEASTVHVPDLTQDPRFVANPFVTGERASMRFYAAEHLRSREGVTFGTLCVFDNDPRELGPDQIGALKILAERIVDVYELQKANRTLASRMSELEALRERLERSNDRLLAFAGQVTHDLKSPLTTMSLSLELIRDELELGAPTEEVVPLIGRALGGSGRMTKMIEDVLSFARLGSQIDPVATDLGALAQQVVQDLEGELGDADLTVGELPTVYGDEALLRALLQNLMSNAAKFHLKGATPQVSVAASRAGDKWRIEVTDNGIGIPIDQMERVFEPMVRLDKTYAGVGVGLATCQRIVDAHEGRIGVMDNVTGKGTTFWVELPA